MDTVPAPSGKSPATVLVLDDDEALRSVVVRVLARNGYRVLEAATAAEAMDVVSEPEGPIDLLLCDLVLPGLSGREAASALVARRPNMKVIFTSGYRSPDSFRRQLDQPGDPFLSKPFEVPELLAAVAAALSGEPSPGT